MEAITISKELIRKENKQRDKENEQAGLLSWIQISGSGGTEQVFSLLHYAVQSDPSTKVASLHTKAPSFQMIYEDN